MRFEPAGMTDDPDIRIANSLMDYLFRRLALDYLSETDRAELGIFSVSERLQPTLPGVEEGAVETVTGQDLAPIDVGASTSGGPPRAPRRTPTHRCVCSVECRWFARAHATHALSVDRPPAVPKPTGGRIKPAVSGERRGRTGPERPAITPMSRFGHRKS